MESWTHLPTCRFHLINWVFLVRHACMKKRFFFVPQIHSCSLGHGDDPGLSIIMNSFFFFFSFASLCSSITRRSYKAVPPRFGRIPKKKKPSSGEPICCSCGSFRIESNPPGQGQDPWTSRSGNYLQSLELSLRDIGFNHIDLIRFFGIIK